MVDLSNFLVVVNSATNFFFFCIWSSSFRSDFLKLLRLKVSRNRATGCSARDPESTTGMLNSCDFRVPPTTPAPFGHAQVASRLSFNQHNWRKLFTIGRHSSEKPIRPIRQGSLTRKTTIVTNGVFFSHSSPADSARPLTSDATIVWLSKLLKPSCTVKIVKFWLALRLYTVGGTFLAF